VKEKIQFIDQLTQETLNLTDEMSSQNNDAAMDHPQAKRSNLDDYFSQSELNYKRRKTDFFTSDHGANKKENIVVNESSISSLSLQYTENNQKNFEYLKNLVNQFPLPFFEGLYIEKMSCFRLKVPMHCLPSHFLQSALLGHSGEINKDEFIFDMPENWDIFPELLVLRKQRQIIENIDFVKISPFTQFVSCVANILNQSKDKSATAFLFIQDQWLLIFFPKSEEEEIILALQLKMNKGVRVIE
jgi:hypothetical protein